MINKTIGIICNIDSPFIIEDLDIKGLGGAETWIIQISLQLAINDYHVIIFNQNKFTMQYDIGNGIEIYPIEHLDRICQYQYFEHIIINRYINNDILDILKRNNNCNNLYFILHDIHLWKNNLFYLGNIDSVLSNNDIKNDYWLNSHLRKIFFMSKWHIDFNKPLCNYDDNLLEVIGNGINISNNIDFDNRDNNILWSSCKERGLDLFITKIMPRIKEKIPDFKLYISSYNNEAGDNSIYQDDIIYLGSLPKEKLYEEMRKHKVSFLPMEHWETFCITSIENISNGVIFLAPYKFGLQTIFKYFESIMLKEGDYNNEEYCNYIANEIVDKINNYKQYIPLQKILYSYIKDNYSWENIFNKLYNIIKTYETNNSYYM